MANIGPGAKDAVFALIAALQDPDTDVRQEAANALGSTGSGTKEATPALIGALKDPSTALNAALSLGAIGPGASEAVPVLIGALSDPNLDLRGNAVTALAKIAPGSREVLRALIAALSDPNVGIRQQAAGALGLIGPGAKEAVPALIAALQDPSTGVREDAAGALGRIGPDANEAVPAPIVALRNPNAALRGNAAYALGEIGPGGKKALPALIAALQDPTPNVRSQAAYALFVLAEASRDTRRTEMVEQLELAAQTVAASGFIPYGDRVRTAAGVLRAIQPPWYQRLLAKLGQHPTAATVAVFYLGLFLVSLVLLTVYPLGLLGLSQEAERMSTAPVITKAIGLGEIVFVFGIFRYNSRVLDAWTAKYIGRARNQFNSLPTAKEREVHVAEMPVELDREVMPGLKPRDLEQTFSRNRTILLLWGEGGSGKTSLACQIARWVMSDDRATRPCAQRMLPILIEQDLSLDVGKDKVVLTEVIRGRLKELTGETDAPSPDLVTHLLKRKRILLIADGLSELSEATRSKLHPVDPEFIANALVVTSRMEENLDNVTKTVLHPHRIEGNRLSSFMEAYLNRCGKRALFDDTEFFEGCTRFSTMVGERDTTVLLAKLYAEQMIAVKEGQAGENLPESVPDLMLEYLNRINREASGMDDRSIHTAAKIIAWECLRHTFRPVPAKFDAVLSALGEDAEAQLERLGQKLRIVETIGVARDRIRFTLDPLAEYLAGLYLVEQNRDNEGSWRQFLAQADAVPGAPETTKGFLLAIRDCCQAKGAEWNVPLWVVGELAGKVGFDGGASKQAQVGQRVKDHMLHPWLPVSEPSETDK
jgi:HEAT repeat protein